MAAMGSITVSAAGVCLAAMSAAGMCFAIMVMVITADMGIVVQGPRQQRFDGIVCAAADATIKLNARLSQRRLCATANAATDQNIHTILRKKTRQSSMAAAIGRNHLGRCDRSLGYIIDLELFRVSKMLKYLSIFVSYCNFHFSISIHFIFCVNIL